MEINEETIENIKELALDYSMVIAGALLTLIVGFWIANRLANLIRKQRTRDKTDETLVNFIARLVGMSIKVFVVIAVMTQLGVKTASFVAVIGAAGLAIGLALQGALSNFASGVLIILFRPFKVGDAVDLAGTFGIVDEISILTVEMHTPDNKKIIVPNSSVLSTTITNFSSFDTRRVDLVFGIGYSDDIEKAKSIIADVFDKDDRILTDPEWTIGVVEHGDSSVNLAARPWVKAADYWDVYFFVMQKVKERFDEEGISIPFPQRDVHMINN